jgi:uncharacterized protein
MSKKMRNYLWVLGGTASLGLGILGIFFPVLPTTPFLLLAAFCYGRGSERFYNWLVYRSIFSEYIRNYREGRGIPLKQKLLTILLLWGTIGFAIGFAVTSWWLRALLLIIAIGVTTHLVRIKTLRSESSEVTEEPTSMESTEIL